MLSLGTPRSLYRKEVKGYIVMTSARGVGIGDGRMGWQKSEPQMLDKNLKFEICSGQYRLSDICTLSVLIFEVRKSEIL